MKIKKKNQKKRREKKRREEKSKKDFSRILYSCLKYLYFFFQLCLLSIDCKVLKILVQKASQNLGKQ